MLYKFKSKATGDLIMLEANGRRVLQIMGKDAGSKGIIAPEQMVAAIAALEAAMAQEEAEQRTVAEQARATGEDAPVNDEAVSLRQRAKPMIDMLRRAAAAQKDIVWGV